MGLGTREISLTLPTDYDEEHLKRRIRKHLGIREFSYQIERKSLDARKKGRVSWKARISVFSKEIKGPAPVQTPDLEIPFTKRGEKIVVVGSGPAGFFAAFVLQKAGFHQS